MRRPGNIMVFTLVACAMLALVLIAGLEVAGLRSATRENRVAILQLEQLHRSALADALAGLNASGETASSGRVLLSDEPIAGQKRQVEVESANERAVIIATTASLDDGSQRHHRVQLYPLPLEERLAFDSDKQALFHASDRSVPVRWLLNHADGDIVVLCDSLWTSGAFEIGDGGAANLSGSVLVTHYMQREFQAHLNAALTLEGNAVFTGDVHLGRDLSCQDAYIDGTLTLDENVRLQATSVYLGEDVPLEVLAQIDAATIYLPHPPELESEDDAAPAISAELLPLPEAPPAPLETRYLMLQQLQ